MKPSCSWVEPPGNECSWVVEGQWGWLDTVGPVEYCDIRDGWVGTGIPVANRGDPGRGRVEFERNGECADAP